MHRDRALKIVLILVGLLFTAGVVPLTMFFSREPAVPMIMSIYVTLGIFLLLAVRDPRECLCSRDSLCFREGTHINK
jgi:hypothetical protein